MKPFVARDSIVRKIWGKSDTILFIFSGAAAEFALNKAVDWLYFTGRLPADPIGRLFSTVSYARVIVFAPEEKALSAIDAMRNIHSAVEKNRGASIPDWAYRDVLFMLIYYSISAFELLERKLTTPEKEEVFDVFFRVGDRMGIKDLPKTYEEWLIMRGTHLKENLFKSDFSLDLFKQYRKHLGAVRYEILIESQKLVVPEEVRKLLGFKKFSWLRGFVPLYKLSRFLRLDSIIKSIILPVNYQKQIRQLDIQEKD